MANIDKELEKPIPMPRLRRLADCLEQALRIQIAGEGVTVLNADHLDAVPPQGRRGDAGGLAGFA